MSTTVELERLEEGDTFLGRGSGSLRLFGRVERVDVRLVVLLVVELHDLARDEGLERIVGVGEVGESVLARHVCNGRDGLGERREEAQEVRVLYALIDCLINNAIPLRHCDVSRT